jgi:ribosome maturation factor RimP
VPEAAESIAAAIQPVVASLGLELFDVELSGAGRARTVRVVLDRDGALDLDAITDATEAISPVLDAHPALVGSYALEVSSPGLERTLRSPAHFRRAVGETLSVKARDASGASRRLRGVLTGADDDGIGLDAGGVTERLSYRDVVSARTVFEWGPAPKPGKSKRRHREAARR